jgi:hypothetical protein
VGPEVIANGGDRFGECWSLLAMEAAFLPVVRATICGWTARLATGAVSRSASRTGIGSMAQSASGQSFVRPLATLRHRLASGLVLPRSRLTSLEATCAVATALKKKEFGLRASCCVSLALRGSASPPRRAHRSAVHAGIFSFSCSRCAEPSRLVRPRRSGQRGNVPGWKRLR